MQSMNGNDTPDRWAVFEGCRRRLFKIAFRMSGAVDDAEDLVQETALRWLQADPQTVRAPEGWLVAVITRLAIDRLRRAAKEREAYGEVGYLEAAMTFESTSAAQPTELASHMSVAVLVLRERLEPTERVAFVLRHVFDCDYEEIARVLEKSEVACRQIVHRARERLRQGRPRFVLRNDARQVLADRFLTALSAGDREAALAVLTEESTAPQRAVRQGVLPLRRRHSPAATRRSWRSGVATASPAA